MSNATVPQWADRANSNRLSNYVSASLRAQIVPFLPACPSSFAAKQLIHEQPVLGAIVILAVALPALLAAAVAGIVPADQALGSFGRPAVMPVAAVLTTGRGLRNTAIVKQVAIAEPLFATGEG